MSDKKLATSKFSVTLKGGFVLTILLFGLVLFLLYMSFKDTKPNSGYSVATGIVFAFTGIPLYRILLVNKIEVYEDYLVLKKVLSHKTEKVYKTDILHWAEKTVPTKKGKYYTLRLYLSHKHIDISQEEYRNYQDLKRHLIVGITDTSEQRQKKFNKNQLVIATTVIVTFLLLLWSGWIYLIITPASTKTKSNTLLITDIITNKPQIASSENSDYIDIKLQSFPNYRFRVEGNSYYAMAVPNFVNDIEPYDTIQVRVKREQFIDKEREINDTANFWVKDETETLFVYEVSNKKYTYLSIENYNKEAIADKELAKYFGFIPLLFTIFGSIHLLKSWKRGSIQPANS